MRQSNHSVDFCIVGGGMAGLCAALAAARNGAKVALVQDRPVLGGNASSEIRMWICGAHGPNNRETGLLEEIQLENLYRNPLVSYSLWDSVLYGKAKEEKNLQLFLNCTCTEAVMTNNRIEAIKCWQMTSETWHTIHALNFADCSGDGILGHLAGARYDIGREAAEEYGESIEPDERDKRTMGMSCLFQIRETDQPQTFIPPAWAYKYESDEDLPFKEHDKVTNFWWIELGGEDDSIHDTEMLRDELVKIVLGVWDHMKNHGYHGVENWVMDWMGFLPGKRESRRFLGDHLLTQNDIEAEGKFDDLVAYGGWSMDDHFPAGFGYKDGYPTIFHEAPSPYGIPYRCLYSANIENLFFAGRNISCTHAALSSTRVMATCALLGQAIGTAAAIATKEKLTPRGIYQKHMEQLKQMLMEDDAYLPWNKREIPALTKAAKLYASCGKPENLVNGYDRPIGDDDNGWHAAIGDWVEFRFDESVMIHEARLVFDSNLNRGIHNMPCNYRLKQTEFHVPETLVKSFRLEIMNESCEWICASKIHENYQRLVKIELGVPALGVRFVPVAAWGSPDVHVFSFDIR